MEDSTQEVVMGGEGKRKEGKRWGEGGRVLSIFHCHSPGITNDNLHPSSSFRFLRYILRSRRKGEREEGIRETAGRKEDR